MMKNINNMRHHITKVCLSVTMNEHHLGAVFEDQISNSTVGQCDAHQVLTLQRQNLQTKIPQYVKNKIQSIQLSHHILKLFKLKPFTREKQRQI